MSTSENQRSSESGCITAVAIVGGILLLIIIAVPAAGGMFLQNLAKVPGSLISPPQPTPTSIVLPAVIDQIKPLGQLHTVSYFLSTVVDTQMNVGALNQTQRVLLVACGKVDGGVDLAKIQPQDIQVKGDKVTLRLPEPEIFTAQLFDDRKCTYVVMRDEGILLPPNTVLETAAREAAVANFRETALQNDILKQARTNAEGEIRRLLTMLGYRDIQFSP